MLIENECNGQVRVYRLDNDGEIGIEQLYWRFFRRPIHRPHENPPG